MANELQFNNIKLSIIVPVYNEQDYIRTSLTTSKAILDKYLTNYEIIVINDGSKDNSQLLINEFIERNEHVKCFEKKDNEGIGSAINLGISSSKNDWILPIPVDSPLDDDTLIKFLSNIEGNDIVVGTRKERVGYSLRMRINSKVFQDLISYLFKINISDYNWIHMYHRDIFEKGGIVITSKGLLMLAEVLIKAHRKGYKIKEVEVIQRERLTGTATASKITTVFKTIGEIYTLYRKLN